MPPVSLATARLVLRPWRDEDRTPYAALNADPVVMEHFPSTLSREESDAQVEHFTRHHAEHGFGVWAVEVPGASPFVGFVGLAVPTWEADFTPCVEVGWRLARSAWGKGYATEAARESVRFGFEEVGLAEILSFTVPQNHRSRHVMEKLGMERTEDFTHPRGAGLHVRYRLDATTWRTHAPSAAHQPPARPAP